MGKHKISWTDETWNPVTGCREISPGCQHCYARTMHSRLGAMGQAKYQQPWHTVKMWPEELEKPLRWEKPRMIFVNSMSDLFHEDVPDTFIYQCCKIMVRASGHTYQILTKRPERMERFAATYSVAYPHIWLGTSVENKQHGLPRIDILRRTQAAVRFLSIEPLLEDLGELDLTGIHWLIIGGESGPGARPFHFEWAFNILKQCREQDVPVFVKQMGSSPAWNLGPVKLRDRKGGSPEEWPEGLRIREMPEV